MWAKAPPFGLQLGAAERVCYRRGGLPRGVEGQFRNGKPMTDPSPARSRADAGNLFTASLADTDPEIADVIARELGRQRDEIELIASENIVSKAVLEAQGSVLTNKYAEGLPGRRYYGGCQYVD